MISLAACVTGFILDFIFGDPAWIYHPVRIIGKGIELGERILRRISGGKHLTAAGAVLWLMIAGLSFLFPLGILLLARKIHPGLCFALESFWCFQILAARSLCRESGKVYDRLQENDLPGARRAVSMIVGRDTESLTEEGVTKAAVETVAENTSDGVTAPLIYLMIGGAPLGFLYKAVNTMDSMLGYKNDRYLYFGRVPAGMDDIFNYIPARLTALLMIAAAYLTGLDGKNAWKIYRRDRKKHASPNAAQTESVCAGALRVQLAGDAVYFGKLYKKEFIGDSLRPIEPQDIRRTQRLMYVTALLVLFLCGGIKAALIFLGGAA
ncbi:MAG TPA: adenosylcobinamide-phosphate synthase CbiB [Candidatus Mediterraneibacter merdigallinarum]|nr:adenosylcobinamide-phosphate synthase CbiB [Candidatus Mediterraneibacter merdigallinarum]